MRRRRVIESAGGVDVREAAAVVAGERAWSVVRGDCIEAMRAMGDRSVDAVVTDPPAGIEFMGAEWDRFKSGRLRAYSKAPSEVKATSGGGKPYDGRPVFAQAANKRCAVCGCYAFSRDPCQCEEPEWETDHSARDTFVGFMTAAMREAWRVLKPGGWIVVWAIPRTAHWAAWSIEEAGFEVRDVVVHLFGQGFPKSLRVDLAVDKAAGGAGEVVGEKEVAVDAWTAGGRERIEAGEWGSYRVDVKKASTEEGKKWGGWGTALKPAAEHWILARKPLGVTVGKNVLKYGTGGLNVDGCRVVHASEADFEAHKRNVEAMKARGGVHGEIPFNASDLSGANDVTAAGRWPTDVVLSHAEGCGGEGCDSDCPVRLLDASAGGVSRYFPTFGYDVNRFCYAPKATSAEREKGCRHLPYRSPAEHVKRKAGSAGLNSPRAGAGRTRGGRNFHPTVKGGKLMDWLVRLVTPPGGIVLDPFAGSGSTGIAAVLGGWRFIGVEANEEYVRIARARIAHASSEAEERERREAALREAAEVEIEVPSNGGKG
jgi:site-specific DNA-methyltransferase (adenine-specific)